MGSIFMKHHCRSCEIKSKQRQIAELRETGKTFREIGEQLGVSAASAHRSYMRSREHASVETTEKRGKE